MKLDSVQLTASPGWVVVHAATLYPEHNSLACNTHRGDNGGKQPESLSVLMLNNQAAGDL